MFPPRPTTSTTPSCSLWYLDDMEPGPVLGAVVASLDPTLLEGLDLIAYLRATDRLASHHEATRSAALALLTDDPDFADLDRVEAVDAVASEARIALTLTRRAAEEAVHEAVDVRDRLPSVLHAWERGRIDRRRVRAILDATQHLDAGEAARVTEAVLDDAPGLTTGQLRARLRRLCLETAPDLARDRFERAHEDRRVWIDATEHGTATLVAADLAPNRLVGVRSRIDAAARSLRAAGDSRTMDQLRADVFLDLLEGGTAPSSRVEIHVDLETLTRLADRPGDLAGYGPVVADIARQVAEDRGSSWGYRVTDTADRRIHTGTTRRRPDAGTARATRALHPTCIFPGCRMPATACDLDHRVPWSEGGPTTPGNLASLCRHDHVVRHRLGWSYEVDDTGTVSWTTALGQVATVRGPP